MRRLTHVTCHRDRQFHVAYQLILDHGDGGKLRFERGVEPNIIDVSYWYGEEVELTQMFQGENRRVKTVNGEWVQEFWYWYEQAFVYISPFVEFSKPS